MESKNPNKMQNGGSQGEHSLRNLELPPPSAGIPRAPGEAWVEERTRVAVGRNITVSGRLVFQEPVRIEGCFRGEVSSIDLVVIAIDSQAAGKSDQDLLAEIPDDMVRSSGGTVKSLVNANLGTLVGRDITIDHGADPTERARVFVLKGRVYQVITQTPQDGDATVAPKFLDSFHLLAK